MQFAVFCVNMNMNYVRFILRGGYRLLTYCRYEGCIEGVLAESEQQTCFADSTVSDEQQFEEIIVRFRHLNTMFTPTCLYYKAVVSRDPLVSAVCSGLTADRCRVQ